MLPDVLLVAYAHLHLGLVQGGLLFRGKAARWARVWGEDEEGRFCAGWGCCGPIVRLPVHPCESLLGETKITLLLPKSR